MAKPSFRGITNSQEWHLINVPDLGIAWFGWRSAKNKRIMKKHQIAFESVLVNIGEYGLGGVLPHSNPELHPDQHIIIQEIEGRRYIIPCEIFESIHHEPCFYLRTVIKK